MARAFHTTRTEPPVQTWAIELNIKILVGKKKKKFGGLSLNQAGFPFEIFTKWKSRLSVSDTSVVNELKLYCWFFSVWVVLIKSRVLTSYIQRRLYSTCRGIDNTNSTLTLYSGLTRSNSAVSSLNFALIISTRRIFKVIKATKKSWV